MSNKVKMLYVVELYKGDAAGHNEADLILRVGTYDYEEPISGVIITSLAKAVSAILAVGHRIQSALLYNTHYRVLGKAVGYYAGGPDETDEPTVFADYALAEFGVENADFEYVYIIGDSPNPALALAIRSFNRLNYGEEEGEPEVEYVPVDVIPEVNQA